MRRCCPASCGPTWSRCSLSWPPPAAPGAGGVSADLGLALPAAAALAGGRSHGAAGLAHPAARSRTLAPALRHPGGGGQHQPLRGQLPTPLRAELEPRSAGPLPPAAQRPPPADQPRRRPPPGGALSPRGPLPLSAHLPAPHLPMRLELIDRRGPVVGSWQLEKESEGFLPTAATAAAASDADGAERAWRGAWPEARSVDLRLSR